MIFLSLIRGKIIYFEKNISGNYMNDEKKYIQNEDNNKDIDEKISKNNRIKCVAKIPATVKTAINSGCNDISDLTKFKENTK